MYTVYNNTIGAAVEVFKTLREAQEYVRLIKKGQTILDKTDSYSILGKGIKRI